MDWDKLRIFHAAAQAGSFTHAGETLEGELLFRTARDVVMQLERVKSRLTDTKDKPSGVLKVTTTVGLGSTWLTARLNEFLELYPEVSLDLILDDGAELDLSMREADVAIWMRPPVQPDLIQRKLFTVHFHLYASPAYLKAHGTPQSIGELDQHRLITFGAAPSTYLRGLNWLETAGRDPASPRRPTLRINNILGIKRAVQKGIGDGYFVYPEEMRSTARVKAFRDFLVAKAERWTF